MKKEIKEFNDSYLVNDRYVIYKDYGVIYDTWMAQDIPQFIFKIRDELLGKENDVL